MSDLYKMKNFLIDSPYIISVPIYEYDITKANINILLKKNAISIEEYKHLKLMSRMSRQVSLGMKQRNCFLMLTILWIMRYYP